MTGGRATARAAALAAVVLAAALSAVPALAAGPTGDRAAIVLFRAAARATNDLPAYVVSQSGYVRIADSLGPRRTVHWAWGFDQGERGYRPATERIELVQRAGKVLWLEDTLTPVPAPCHAEKCAPVLPIQLVITRTAAFAGLISSGTAASCVVREPLAKVPYPAGFAWWAPVGRLSPAVRAGALTAITSRFSSGGQAVTETDWLRASSRLFDKSVVRFAAGDGRHAFTYESRDARLPTTPRFPALTLCS